MVDFNGWLVISYVTTIFAVTAFAVFAVLYTRFFSKAQNATTEDFITARRTQNKWRVAWSFFAGAIGAWVIVSPAFYASYAGVLGLCFYSLASGIPIMVAALFGEKIQKAMPHCCSLSDFIGYRFGAVAKIFVILITLFNMSIAMLAEYTTIGSLFQDFVGSINYPIILVVGALTLIYTAYGGLSVSIMTDQVQGALSVGLISLLTVYVAATFREPLPENYGEARDYLGVNVFGLSAIFVMPCSLMAATVFSEAIWQRVWASQDKAALRFGALWGGIGVIIAVFLAGFAGVLAVWAGLVTEDTNPNLYMFQIFKAQSDSATVASWVGVITLILAITMNESAIDSLQNGIAATISAQFFRTRPVAYARAVVVLANIPLVAVATKNYNVLSLFLITNMLCTCWFIPVCLGLWDTPTGRRYVTETGVVLAGIIAMLSTTAYGIGKVWDPSDIATSFAAGADMAWYSNGYAWDYFLVAACTSVGGLLQVVVVKELLALAGIQGPGLSALAAKVPGFKYIAGAESAPGKAVEEETDVVFKGEGETDITAKI